LIDRLARGLEARRARQFRAAPDPDTIEHRNARGLAAYERQRTERQHLNPYRE